MLQIAAENLAESEVFESAVLGVPEAYLEFSTEICKKLPRSVRWEVVAGGETRRQTLANMLGFARSWVTPGNECVVSLLDANRPLVPPSVFRACLQGARAHGFACPSMRLADGLGEVDANGALTAIASTRGLLRLATPESFLLSKYDELPLAVTSDPNLLGVGELFIAAGFPVTTVTADIRCMKVTHPEDWKLFELLWANRDVLGQPDRSHPAG